MAAGAGSGGGGWVSAEMSEGRGSGNGGGGGAGGGGWDVAWMEADQDVSLLRASTAAATLFTVKYSLTFPP